MRCFSWHRQGGEGRGRWEPGVAMLLEVSLLTIGIKYDLALTCPLIFHICFFFFGQKNENENTNIQFEDVCPHITLPKLQPLATWGPIIY